MARGRGGGQPSGGHRGRCRNPLIRTGQAGGGAAMTICNRQRGSALLIALVVAALAALIATAVLERARQGLARSEALLATERSWQYASGMTWLAEKMLREALAEGADPAALGDGWSAPFDVPGGMVVGRWSGSVVGFYVNVLGRTRRYMDAA